MTAPKSAFMAGVKTITPILLGVVPFSLIAGIAGIEAGLTPGLTIGMSVIVFAGASQLAADQLIGAGAAPVVVILTAVVINLRFVMYSASLGPHFQRLSLGTKALLAYLMTDQAYALSIIRYENRPDNRHKKWFYLGTALPLWVIWLAGTVVGVFVGAQVPPEWSLDFAIPLTFMALLVPSLKDRPSLIAALAAGLTLAVAFNAPFNLGLIIAATVGVAAGVISETWLGRSQ